MDELLGEQDAAGLRDPDRGGAEVLPKQAAHLPLAHSQPLGQRLDVAAVQRAQLDQRQPAR